MTQATDTNRHGHRVGYLLRMYPRFTQTFIVNEMLELERQGLDLALMSLRKPNEGIFHESISRIQARAHYVPESRHGRTRQFAGWHWEHFRRSPGAYRRARGVVHGDRTAEPYDLTRAMHVLRWVRKNDVGHVHVHFGTSEATVALAAHELGGLSYSLTLHAFDIFRETVDHELLARKINASRFTVTVSEFNRRFLVENLPGVDAGRIHVNYNGIDLGRFRPLPGQERDPTMVVGVGRLKEKKGFKHLVEAVARLHKEGLPVRCKIVGEGPDEKSLRKQIAKRGLEGAVELTGPLPQQKVCELIQRAGCFVLPCIEAADGNMDALPTVLLEAMAAGCPVISNALSGVPEIIEDGVSGRLVSPGDDKALAQAIRDVVTDDSLARLLSEGGRRRAETRFDVTKNVEIMRGWLESALVRPAPASGRSNHRLEEGATTVKIQEAQASVPTDLATEGG